MKPCNRCNIPWSLPEVPEAQDGGHKTSGRTSGAGGKGRKGMNLTIDDEFKQMCPALAPEEYALLEASILKEGLRDELVAWDGIILDGHQRFAICTEHGIDMPVRKIKFDTRDEAKQWILLNQLSRRNLTGLQIAYLRGKYYRSFGLSRGGCGDRHKPCYKKGEKRDTVADTLAKQFKVASTVIFKDALLADAIDSLEPTVRTAILDREFPAAKQHVIDLSGLSHESQKLVIDGIRKESLTSLQDAIFRLRPKGIQGASPRKCKTCGMKLAAGVVVCLRCDLTDKQVKEKLKAAENYSAKMTAMSAPAEPDDDWQDRLIALRAAKESGDQIVFYCDQIIAFVEENEVQRNTPTHRRLFALMEALGNVLGKNKRFAGVA